MHGRHRIRFFIEQVGEFVGAAYTLLRDRSGEGNQANLEANIKNIEGLLAEQSANGPFFLGDHFTLADIAIVRYGFHPNKT